MLRRIAAWKLALLLGLLIALAGAPGASAYVYWANSTTIGRGNLDGSSTPNQSFVTGLNSGGGVAVDGAYIYWTNGGNPPNSSIGRANLDGTGANQSFISGSNVSFPSAVAVDGAHIYWTNNTYVARANLDGSGVAPNFIKAANTDTGVAVDSAHIYWSTYDGFVARANLDGTGVAKNFISTTLGTVGVAVDAAHVYWTAFKTIGRANLDGTGVNQSFIAAPNSPNGVAVDGAHIYWTNSTGTIGRANLDGTGVNQSFLTGATNPNGLAVDGLPSGSVSPSATSLAFGSQPLGVFGPPQSVTIANNEFGALGLGRVSLGGNSDDFLISSDGCSLLTLRISASCTIGVRFGPSAGGPRSATLSVPSDDPASPLTVGLSGSGGALPQGPQGPSGPAGAAGQPGVVELVRCSTVFKTVVKKMHGKRRKTKVPTQSCTTSLVSSPVKFTATGKAVAASLARGGVVYASGNATRDGLRAQLTAAGGRRIAPGRYVLRLGAGRGSKRRSVTVR